MVAASRQGKAGASRTSDSPLETFDDAIADSDAPSAVTETVEELVQLEQRDRADSWSDRLADRIANAAGSSWIILIHMVWFTVWIIANLPWPGWRAIDPYPFGLLTMIVSLDAIFLALFVLMAQKRQSEAADRRARLDLQINLITERELTKSMQLIAEIHDELGLHRSSDRELEEMKQPTAVEVIADAVEEAQQKALDAENDPSPPDSK